ncbi:MAG: NAD(P)H-dependent glycerol-3-phosphate dehydrogenase [Gammaproteobacteria bacterium]|nr:NAD(P)H-dependent glycerol-3-phosphate dehydrogenase [Gammaproteobacteria bacterium]
MSSSQKALAVIGAGSWGTALAIQFARAGRRTLLWGRDARQLEMLAGDRCNRRYLPGAGFPDSLEVVPDLGDAVKQAGDILVCVPSHAFHETLVALRPHLAADARLCWATKGFEMDTGRLPHQVAADVLGATLPTAVLSGPTFAREVGAGLPTAMTVASENEEFARDLAESISDHGFRAYTSSDITGVEVGGAVKNVLAIGAGISDGLGYGANTRVALITRGLSEMTRLGLALGARPETFMGLAGMGDLILTCTDDQSRNRRMGLALAAGKTVAEAETEIQQVVEGVQAARAVWQLAHKLGVEMPITEQVYRVLYEGLKPAEAVQNLMGRQLRGEHD